MLNLKLNWWLFPSILTTSVVLLNGCTAEKTTSQTPNASPAPVSASSPSVSQAEPNSNSVPSEPKKASPTDVATSQEPPAAANQKAGNRVTLADGKVSFVLPPGFTEMTREEISLKFPNRGNPPTHAYGNEARNVAIAVTFSPAKVSPEQLPELKTVMREQLGKALPGTQWLKDELTTINGKPWVHLSIVTQAIDTKIHNDMYFTSLDGKMMGFNFNSTVKEYDKAKSELEKTMNSIEVR